jgi:hypothetical protein
MYRIEQKFLSLTKRFALRLGAVVVALSMMPVAVNASVTDLPHKTVNGTEYYYYVVKENDATYALLQELGITYKELKKYNRAANDGLRPGMTLYFPYKEMNERYKNTDTAKSNSKKKAVTEVAVTDSGTDNVAVEVEQPDEAPVVVVSATEDLSLKEPEANQTIETPVVVEPMRIAVMLPFMLDSDKSDKASSRAMDFYRGFLLGLDSLSRDSRDLRITTFDTANDNSKVKRLLGSESALLEADIIIAPDNDEQYAAIAAFGDTHGNRVLNPFIVKDSLYMTNAAAMQLNIDQKAMYDKAADYYVANLNGYMPVFVTNTEGRDEKKAFVDILKARLADNGIAYQTIDHVGNMYASALEDKLGSTGKYVFIPISGSYNEFVKINRALLKYKDTLQDAGGDLRLFGYPDWTTFRGEALDNLHRLDAVIYSRFYSNPDSFETRRFKDSYAAWFGGAPDDGVPSMSMLGFDVADYLLNVADRSSGKLVTADWFAPTRGEQNAFEFVEYPDGGLINRALYIIRFAPGTGIEIEVL